MGAKYDSRKFVDLILSSASKWANWDPPRPINVGDYGSVNNETGEFMWEGNIYGEYFQELLDKSPGPIKIDLKDPALQPEVSEGDDKIIISSSGVYASEARLAAEVLQSEANVSLRFNFDFRDKGGAGMVLYKPQYSSFPKDERLTSLLKTAREILRGKCIVTEVISCPAYLIVLSGQKGERFSASLSATRTDPVATTDREASTSAIFNPLYKLTQPRRTSWNFTFGQQGSNSALVDWRLSAGHGMTRLKKWRDMIQQWTMTLAQTVGWNPTKAETQRRM
ncbi:hypothetical protein HYDPIDRAFT_31974 [Hydnomerulius pinastri MD-312]|uniref:Uncharacterized protein n=1 Tax=Hydnomerulius pinastri MD-312 TaxID=994086 RepID=A0A0C9WBF0_9AGAM|nr:hypothetical protein HYDPIDRAFT_31974 [Hydnomerulius pinastri MD-312]